MAAWCAPCIKELPDLNALYTKYSANGLKMVGVSVDFDGPSAMQPIVDRLKVDFPIFWLGEEALEAFGISGIPLLIFIKNGSEVEKVVGLHSKGFFAEKIETFLTMP
jgi:thiol-disulfide isomerase/thioredoxin